LPFAAQATDFSPERARRLNAAEFNKEMKGMHVLPSPAFFEQQLKNMCQFLEHEGLSFYMCHHLAEKQQYFLPILKHHEDSEATEHVFVLRLMPQKLYLHEGKPVAVTSKAEAEGELRVLVPRSTISADRLKEKATELLKLS
tara:strand:+ start:1231 stop:1656 length:426 start_codon:yes stop_codon:yes gene_type:complete